MLGRDGEMFGSEPSDPTDNVIVIGSSMDKQEFVHQRGERVGGRR